MRHLAEMQPHERDRLIERSQATCVIRPNTELPQGCEPTHARVGIESEASGEVTLFVDLGIQYSGSNRRVREWTSSGVTLFPSIEDFWDWVDLQRESSGYSPPIVDLDAIDTAGVGRRVPPDAPEILDVLRQSIFGQETALETIASATARHIAKSEPQRPLTLFALGPTGTGKTATAMSLARTLSDLTSGEYGILRLDMVEYQEPHSTARLFGSPPGYIGYSDGTSLVDVLAENKRTVVVFDEIEKAHDNVLAALMALMDAGRMTGSAGGPRATVDARHAILMFTSNLGAQDLSRLIGSSEDATEIDRLGRAHLRSHGVAAELVGRIHRVVVYEPMSDNAKASIIADVVGRTGYSYGLDVREILPEAMSEILPLWGMADSASGARSVVYLVDEVVGDLFADATRSGRTGAVNLAGSPLRIEPLDMDCLDICTTGEVGSDQSFEITGGGER